MVCYSDPRRSPGWSHPSRSSRPRSAPIISIIVTIMFSSIMTITIISSSSSRSSSSSSSSRSGSSITITIVIRVGP